MKKITHSKILAGLCLGTTIAGCANFSSRQPSSDIPSDSSLKELIEEVTLTATGEASHNNQVCQVRYELLYKALYNLSNNSDVLPAKDLEGVDELIKSSFMARIKLQESLKHFSAPISEECLKHATNVFRALRYAEDYLIEEHMELSKNAPNDYVDMKGDFPYLLVNPKYKESFKSYKDLESGDLILSRGNAFSSAAIARIGARDYQFSHISFVYKNPETKELLTTEAHIEIGSVVEPIKDHIEQENTRSVIFRYKDPEIAHKASAFIMTKVKKGQETKKNIPYDFASDINDHARLSCTDIVSEGFKAALPNEDYFPLYKSKYNSGIIPFLNTVGIPVTSESLGKTDVFTPGDIQFDPRFEIVAEWRNPKKTESSRLKDFIITKMFEYMEKDNYKIDPKLSMEAKSKLVWTLRRTPIVKKYLKEKFPLNMSTSQLELFMAIDKIGESFYKEVEKASLNYSREMTPAEIYSVLDKFYKRDAALYAKYKRGQKVERPAFHLLFHP